MLDTEGPISISHLADLESLLEDKSFIDYFNVYLSLPIFGQHLLYNYTEKLFYYDPPLRRRWRFVDKRCVLEWLQTSRLPFFAKTILYCDYTLCTKLRDVKFPTASEADSANAISGDHFVGSVVGMQLFRQSLKGTCGEIVYRCWIDIERYKNCKTEDPKKKELLAHIRKMYISNGAPRELANIHKPFAYLSSFNFHLIPEKAFIGEVITEPFEGKDAYPEQFQEEKLVLLQKILLEALKRYWLPRYYLHFLRTAPPNVVMSVLKRQTLDEEELLNLKRKLIHDFLFSRNKEGESSAGQTPSPAFEAITMEDMDQLFEEILSSSSSSESEMESPPVKPEDLLSLWGGHTVSVQMPELTDGLSEVTDEKLDGSPETLEESDYCTQSSKSGFLTPGGDAEKINSPSKEETFLPKMLLSYVKGRRRRFSTSYVGIQNRSLCALASDTFAGSPFELYLANSNMVLDMNYLSFWNDMRKYLDIDETSTEPSISNLRKFLAKKIAEKYLSSPEQGESNQLFSEQLKMSMFRCLLAGDNETLLHTAHDIVSSALEQPLKQFIQADKKNFKREVSGQRYLGNKPAAIQEYEPLSPDGRPYFYNNPDAVRMVSSQSDTVDDSKYCSAQLPIYLSEEEVWRALELTVICSEGGIAFPDVCDYNDLLNTVCGDIGSMSKAPDKPKRHEQLQTLRQQMFPEKIDIEKIRVSRRVLLEKPEVLGQKNVIKSLEDSPACRRLVIRRNGVQVQKPPRPRNFIEMFTDDRHFEFFKHFMTLHKAIPQLQFWKAVEELKSITVPRNRSNRVSQICRRFFSKAAKYGMILGCNDDMVRQIPFMEKVSAGMLVCAQNAVFRTMERKWYPLYLDTYPSETDESGTKLQVIPAVSASDFEEPGDATETSEWVPKRKIQRKRTVHLWKSFTFIVRKFTLSLKRPAVLKLMDLFLRKEIEREASPVGAPPPRRDVKDRGLSTMSLSAQTRVILKNRLIVLNKLPADLLFWKEVGRYREQVDSVMMSSNITPDDTFMLTEKARAIIDCYLASEIPPRVQINIPNDMALQVIQTLAAKGPNFGLFHDAQIQLLPILYHYWRRFTEEWLKYDTPEHILSVLEASETAFKCGSPHAMEKIPDYSKATVEDCKTVHVIASNSEDEGCSRISFSLLNGLRLIVPQPKAKPPLVHKYSMKKNSMTNVNSRFGRLQKQDSNMGLLKGSGKSFLQYNYNLDEKRSTSRHVFPRSGHIVSPLSKVKHIEPMKVRRLSQMVESLNEQTKGRPKRFGFPALDSVAETASTFEEDSMFSKGVGAF